MFRFRRIRHRKIIQTRTSAAHFRTTEKIPEHLFQTISAYNKIHKSLCVRLLQPHEFPSSVFIKKLKLNKCASALQVDGATSNRRLLKLLNSTSVSLTDRKQFCHNESHICICGFTQTLTATLPSVYLLLRCGFVVEVRRSCELFNCWWSR